MLSGVKSKSLLTARQRLRLTTINYKILERPYHFLFPCIMRQTMKETTALRTEFYWIKFVWYPFRPGIIFCFEITFSWCFCNACYFSPLFFCQFINNWAKQQENKETFHFKKRKLTIKELPQDVCILHRQDNYLFLFLFTLDREKCWTNVLLLMNIRSLLCFLQRVQMWNEYSCLP